MSFLFKMRRCILLALSCVLVSGSYAGTTNAAPLGLPASGTDVPHGVPKTNYQPGQHYATSDWNITILLAGLTPLDVSADGQVVLLQDSHSTYYRWSAGVLENLGQGGKAFINNSGAIAVELAPLPEVGDTITVTQPGDASFKFQHHSQVHRFEHVDLYNNGHGPLTYYTYSSNNQLLQLDDQNNIWFEYEDENTVTSSRVADQTNNDRPVLANNGEVMGVGQVSRSGHTIGSNKSTQFVDGAIVSNLSPLYVNDNGTYLAQVGPESFTHNPTVVYTDGHTDILPDWLDLTTYTYPFDFIAKWVDKFDGINGTRASANTPAILRKKIGATGQPLSPAQYDIFDYVQLVFPSGSGWTTDHRVASDTILPQVGIATSTIDSNQTRPFLATRRIQIAVDTNHDGIIKLSYEDDSDATSAADPFSFGPNTDHDNGNPNILDYDTGHVNGAADLKDFVPVFLDLRSYLTALPPGNGVTYTLKQDDAALNFTCTNLNKATAFDYLTSVEPTGFGLALDRSAATADTAQITRGGVDLFSGMATQAQFFSAIMNQNGGVILLEARQYSDKPLILEIKKDANIVVQVQVPLLLTSVNLAVDANNDGKIDSTDVALLAAAQASNASATDKANGTKYLFVNDSESNGAWDSDDASKPATQTDDDDTQELQIVLGVNSGALWFEHPSIEKLAFYRAKACSATDQISFPWQLSPSNPFPKKLYVRAEGSFSSQVEGNLVLKLGASDKSQVFAQSLIPLTIVTGVGDTKFFEACYDYIMKNNAKFYTIEKQYGGEKIRTVVMLQRQTKIKALDGYYRNPSVSYIQAAVDNFPNYAVIVNGMFEDNGFAGMSPPKGQGRLISDGVFDSDYSTDRGPQWYYIAQSGTGSFTFGSGETPLNAGYKEAMGGLYRDYVAADARASTMVGQATARGERLIFVAVTDIRIGGITGSNGDEVVGFVNDVTAAGGSDVTLFDGGSSCALAYSNPSDVISVQFNGSKHYYPIGVPYHIHSFLMFDSHKPR